MYNLHDEVMVIYKKKIKGFGKIIDICKTEKDLKKYFHKQHPIFNRYRFALQNEEWVYIIDYAHDMGRAGYLKKELRRQGKKIESISG